MPLGKVWNWSRASVWPFCQRHHYSFHFQVGCSQGLYQSYITNPSPSNNLWWTWLGGTVLSESEREHCALFDFDTTLSCKGYYFYDYRDPTKINNECLQSFDMVVIDPPFISHSVWEEYAKTAKCLLKADKGTLVLATTVGENEVLLKTLFGKSCNPALFRPCIPNLVYQYSIFSNWQSSILSVKNNALWQGILYCCLQQPNQAATETSGFKQLSTALPSGFVEEESDATTPLD